MSEKDTDMSKKGIDPSKINLDDAGRVELDDAQLEELAGGRPNCGKGQIEVIRAGKCRCE